MNLVIVETPAQAKRVSDAVGEGWQVEPCYGAVRDLPADALGVDVRHNFQPSYTLLPRKGNLVRRLMRAISKTDAVYVATPPDRAGEAMGWNLLALSPTLENKPVYRILLHALTLDAIRAAFDSPGSLDLSWIEAQETQHIADRLVRYLVSPLASKALNVDVSFSRAEVDCLRLLVEREREITAFKPATTWMLTARLSAEESEVAARLCNTRGAPLTLGSRQQADKLAALLANAAFWVDKAAVRTAERPAPQAYTSQTLLADAALRLQFAPGRVLSVAQTLYEAAWITYPHTDSVAASAETLTAARTYILREYGAEYLPTESDYLNASTGLEGIRPANVSLVPENLPGDGAALYGMIWRRFVASCMVSAQYRQSAARIFSGISADKPFPFEFRTRARLLTFDGWLRTLPDAVEPEHGVCPHIADSTSLKLIEILVHERTSEAQARYTPTGLIALLSAHRISRPAAYLSAIDALTNSGYVQVADKRLAPTEQGIALAGFIEAHFADTLSLDASAELEATFERIAAGETNRVDVLEQFWTRLSPELHTAAHAVLNGELANSELSTVSHEHRPVVLRPLAEG